MSFNFEEVLSNNPDVTIDLGDWENWTENRPVAVSPGTYLGILDEVRNVEIKRNDDGIANVVALLDVGIVNDPDAEGRIIRYQRVNTYKRPFGNKESSISDLLHAASVNQPTGTADIVRAIQTMLETAVPFRFRLGWTGRCQTCFADRLIQLTGKTTLDDAQKHVRDNSAWDLRDQANKFALKAKSEREFPRDGNDSLRDFFTCPDCSSEVRAREVIRDYLAPTN